MVIGTITEVTVKYHCWRILDAFSIDVELKNDVLGRLVAPAMQFRLEVQSNSFTLYQGRSPKSPLNSVPEVGPLLSEHLKSNSLGKTVWLQAASWRQKPVPPRGSLRKAMSISRNLQDQSSRLDFLLFPIDFTQSEEPRMVLK